jgi:hypothetical protein
MRISRQVDLAEIELRGKYWVQAPYLECYLNGDGTELLYNPMKDGENQAFTNSITPGTRLCFFLHFIDSMRQALFRAGNSVWNLGVERPKRFECKEMLRNHGIVLSWSL